MNNGHAKETVSSLDGPRLLRTVSSTPSFHIPSLSGMRYLQGMICHSSNPKSSLLTCVMAVHSTNHALTAVIMILKDRNSLHIKIISVFIISVHSMAAMIVLIILLFFSLNKHYMSAMIVLIIWSYFFFE